MAYDGSLVFDTKIDRSGFEKGVKQLGSMGKIAFGAVSKSVVAVSTAVAGIGIASAKVGSDFSSSMSGVAATMGITVDEINSGSESFEMLKDAAKEAGKTTKYSASESAEALNYLALAGYDAEKSVEALPKVLNLAAAGGLDLAYASDLVTDSMSALGMETDELEGFVDELAKTSQKSNTDISQLGEAILNIGGTAKILAGGTVELNTQLGILADNGVKGAEGGTALRNVLLSLSAPTDKQASLMKALGIETYDANGNFRSTDDIFQELNATLREMTEQERTEVLSNLFNKVDLKAANALLAGSGERFGELSNEIANADGAAEAMAETLNNNLKGKIGLLSSALEGLGIEIYENMDGPLNSVVDTAIGYVDQITNVLTAHDDIKASAEELGMTAEELGFNLSEIPNGLDGAVQVVGDILVDMIAKVAENAPKFMNVAVNLIKSFLEGIRKNHKNISESAVQIIMLMVETFFDLMPEIIQTGVWIVISMLEGIADNLPEIVKGATEMIDTIIDVVMDNLPLILELGIQIILAIFQGLIESLPKVIEGTLSMIDTIIDVIIDNLPEVVSMGIEIIVALIAGLIKALPQLASRVPEIIDAITLALATGIVDIIQVGVDIVKGLWQGILSMKDWIVGKVKGFGKSIADGFKGFFGIRSPSTLMKKYGKNIVEGLEVGIKENKTQAEQAMYDMARSIVTEFDRLGDALVTALRNRYKEQERIELDGLRRSLDNVRKATADKLKEYEREFQAKLKLLNIETSEEVRAIQEQIDSINEKTAAEERELREQEYNKRVALKEKEILEEEDAERIIALQEELSEIIARRERELLLEQRNMQIEALREEMERIRQQGEDKKLKLEEEYELKKANEEAKLEAVIEHLEAEMEATKGHYETLLKEENLQAEARLLILDENNEEMVELLESYYPEWYNAGRSFGENLLEGLSSMKDAIRSEIDSIMGMLDEADMQGARDNNDYVSREERDNRDVANHNIVKAKEHWIDAKNRGDEAGMRAAEKIAEDMRKIGGTIGADVGMEEAYEMLRNNQRQMSRNMDTMSLGRSVTNNDNGITQNVTIVSPENTPSENARKLKQVGRDMALGY